MLPIDAAQAAVIDPRDRYNVALLGAAAVCIALADQPSGPDLVSNELIGAAKGLLDQQTICANSQDHEGYVPVIAGLKRAEAFLAFQSLFSMEFSDVQN